MSRAGAFETIVGLIVIAVAALFLWYAAGVSGDRGRVADYQLDAIFGRVDGLSVGADVKIAGISVGEVSASALDPATYEATVAMRINHNVQVPDDSVAKIVSDGFLGGAHISIEPGASEDYLREGDTITITRGSVDLLNLAVQAFTNQQRSGASNDAPAEDPLGEF